MDPGAPVYITEAGISSSGYGSAAWGVTSEYTQGIIDANVLLDGYKQGASKTFLYDLMDEVGPSNAQEDHFGLFNADGTAKPVATDIHNLTTILADPGTGRVPLGTLAYQISGLPSTASSMLLEKSDGTFEIVIWNGDATVSNGTSDVTPLSTTVTVTFGSSHLQINLYDPIQSAVALQSFDNSNSVSFSLAAEPIIVEIAPGQAPPLVPAPVISSFSPDSNVTGDGITDVNDLTLTGTAAVGSTVDVFDGTNQIGTTISNSSGAWSFATGALADGNHSFTSMAVDATGDFSAVSAALHVAIDTVAPIAPDILSYTSASASSLTITGTAEFGSTVTLFGGTVLLGTGLAGADGAWTINAGLLSSGPHEFTATATDAAGNISDHSTVYDPIIGPMPIMTNSFVSTGLLSSDLNSTRAQTTSLLPHNAGSGSVEAADTANENWADGWHFGLTSNSINRTVARSDAAAVASDVRETSLVAIGGRGNDSFIFHPAITTNSTANVRPAAAIELDRFSAKNDHSQLATSLNDAHYSPSAWLFHTSDHDHITLTEFHLAGIHASNFVIA